MAADLDYTKLSRQQKLAVFLIVIGPEAAAELLRQFDDPEIELLCREMSTLTIIPGPVQKQAIEEFSALVAQSAGSVMGGLGYYKLRSAAREVPNCFERRCIYFAGEEGHAEFLRRVFDRKPHRTAEWSVKFDREVVGAWSKYATVWRVMPEMPSREYLDPKSSFFFW